jgi:hypothetical protein
MTPEDRELLQGLRRQQLELQQALARLDEKMGDLEARVAVTTDETPPSAPVLPPIPPLPPIPSHDDLPHFLPPLPPLTETSLPHLPPIPKPPVRAPEASLEFQFGRWLTRMGAVFGVIALALIFSWAHSRIFHLLGRGGLITLSTLASLGVVMLGGRLETKGASFWIFGRSIMTMALAWLYVTAYAACYSETYQIIQSPLVAGVLLVIWSAYVLALAERKQSQTMALFAISLAYFSTAINPIGRFTMAADFFLTGTAVLLMIRNGWSALSYFSLAGTYLALLRRLVIDQDGEFVFDAGRTLHFWPYAIYLTGTWAIFTAGVWFTGTPHFRGGKRLTFLSLNNGAWAGLLLFTAYIAGYGHGPMGWILLSTGFILLVTSRFVGWTDIEPGNVMAAYAAQGLALFTAGTIVVFTGITRGLMLTLETLLFGCAGTFSADRVLLVTTYFSAFFATLFLIWEISVNAHHPWLLGFTGATVMLLNAWMARSDIRHSPKARSTMVLGSAYYCTLGCGLIFTGLCMSMSENALPPALAMAAMVLTFLIYYFSLYELPPIAQTLLLAAQALVIFPFDSGEETPWWTTFGVAGVTLILVTWWSRQRITRTGSWTKSLTVIYALALASLTFETVRPWVDLQGWMILASILSVAYLVWGTLTRTWSMAAVGQLFLAMALYHFFIPPGDKPFPWAWWAAAIPLIVVFSTARATHVWLDLFPEIPEHRRIPLRALAYGYQLLTLAMVVRAVSSVVPPLEQIAVFLFLGTLVLSWNSRTPSLFGIRCSYVLTLLGLLLFLQNLNENAAELATFINALAFLSILIQPTLLRRTGKLTVTSFESWALLLLSVGAGLFFVTTWVETRFSLSYLTMNWALYGLFLFLFGLIVHEPRLRWCGLAVLVIAIVRVFLSDFWGLSIGYRVVTFIVLTMICLGMGLITLRSERSKHPV